MAKKTIQIADKPTLDEIKALLENGSSGGFSIITREFDDSEYVIGSDKKLTDIPYGFYQGCAVVLNNEIHILGGYDGSSDGLTSHYKWDGTAWVSVSTLPYKFYNGCAVVLNNEIHIMGNCYGSHSYQHLYKWDGTAWVKVSMLPYAFCNGCAVVLNNEIHVLGNRASDKKHYKWDGTAWVSVSTLPYSFYRGDAVVLNNEIHIIGDGGGNTYKHYKWDGAAWVSVSTLPYPFNYGCAVVLDGEIHILGSINDYLTKHYKWDGAAWVSVSTLPYPFNYGCAVVLDGEIHILGGGGTSNTSNAIFHYVILQRNGKLSRLFLFKGQRIYSTYDISRTCPISNCSKETDHLIVTEDGIVEFAALYTEDAKITLTIR